MGATIDAVSTKKKILILGSTGSIGTQAIEVIEENPGRFEVVGIAAAGSNPDQVVQQARLLGLAPEQVAVAKPEAAQIVGEASAGRC